jgi:hypothetical protein
MLQRWFKMVQLQILALFARRLKARSTYGSARQQPSTRRFHVKVSEYARQQPSWQISFQMAFPRPFNRFQLSSTTFRRLFILH